MKKYFLALICVFYMGCIYANDTYFYTSGGNLIPAEEKDISVQMKSEVISIVLQPEYYEVTVDFDFYNSGKAVELLVGFPFFEVGIGGHGKFYDFKCWTNDELTDFSDKPLERNFSNNNYKDPQLEKAYTRTIKFPQKASTKTRVYYKSEYGYDTDGYIVNYLYGTGSSWRDVIGEMTVILENNLKYSRPNDFKLPGEISAFKPIADNKWEAHFYNIEPEYKECITIHAKDILDDTGPKCFPGYGYKFRDKDAQPEWLFWYTSPQLRIARNTVYALHGYDFKSEDLKSLFTEWGKNWNPNYKVNLNFSEEELSEREKKNIKLIYAEEQRRKKLYNR